MRPKADPQQADVYWLEAEFNGWWRMVRSTRSDLLDLTTAVCKYYGVDEPKVTLSRKEAKHDGDYLHSEITLYKHGQNPGVLIHELAHHITDWLYLDVENHGPEFVAIYMHLLDKWCFLPNEEFRRLAKKYKVKIGRRYRPHAFKNGKRPAE